MDFNSGAITAFKSYHMRSQSGAARDYYSAGYYFAPAADTSLSQAGTTQTLGAANVPYAAHAFLVAADVGTATGGSGAVTVVVSGTSMSDTAGRNAGDSETIVADITALATDDYVETAKKWIGQTTFTLTVGATGHTAYALDFNYGLAKYEDFGNRPFILTDFEVIGDCNAADAGYNCQLLHHKATGWTYSAAAFSPGTTPLYDFATVNGTESDLDANEPYAGKESNIATAIDGANSEGLVILTTTTTNNAIGYQDMHIGVSI